ncbi:hypothetical protein, variant 1 [Verruconis gallopava]|uniref:LEM-like domain-containing protein n=1 Tax=Verruconis gallopava TaxID=253628 RepID=A0A0D1XL14_9PEZI|nr:hypothetical protein, variant 1 [Verruconis gallopava]KIW03021.1 hypothetical protein, variant 1 [Verruconis gallopava]
MEEDDLFYLAPGFDPATLTVPRLRNVLLTHNIEYPSNAKKPQLLQLFNDELVPQAKKLLAASKRVKRSARGIEDVPSSQTSTVDEDELPQPEPAPTPARRGGRRKTKPVEEDLSSEATLIAPESTARPRRTTTRATRSMEPEHLDPEPATAPVPAPKRRGRPSMKTPKQESPDPEAWHKPAEDSPFTMDNPFQSGGSSPPPQAHGADRRRRTIEPSVGTEKRKSTSSRRKTDGVVASKSEASAKGSAYEIPVATMKRKKSPSADSELVPAGEEFAPDEALELAQQEASGQLVRPPRRREGGSGSFILQGLLWPLVISAGFLGTLWVQEKYSVGYCGVGNEPRMEIAGKEIPEWADSLRPQCEPCPQHAFCYQNLETKCEDGFVLQHHPLTLGGNLPIPLPPSCEPDTEKTRKVQHVVQRAVDVLRDRNAAYECGEPLAGETTPLKSAAISEEELKATLSAKRTKKMSQEEFDALFAEAIPEIMNRDEVVTVENTGVGANSFVFSTAEPDIFEVLLGPSSRSSVHSERPSVSSSSTSGLDSDESWLSIFGPLH